MSTALALELPTTDKFIKHLGQRIASLQTGLDEWKQRFEENPFYALRNADHPLKLAAESQILERLLEISTGLKARALKGEFKNSELPPLDGEEWIWKELDRGMSNATFSSTSNSTNMAELAYMQAVNNALGKGGLGNWRYGFLDMIAEINATRTA